MEFAGIRRIQAVHRAPRRFFPTGAWNRRLIQAGGFMVEIIFFIYLVMGKGGLDQAHYYAWHTYDQGPKFLIDRPCEETIQDAAFQLHLQTQLKPGQKGKLLCRSASELGPLEELASSDGVEILPKKPGRGKESGIHKFEGKLVHRPYESGRKSMASYMGQEFFLQLPDGKEVALYTTDRVTREYLMKLKDRKVRVQAKLVDRTPRIDPDQPASFPVGPDGGPVKRIGYEVISIKHR